MPAILEGLHETNRRLRALLDSVAPASTTLRPVTPDQLASFLNELLQAGELLRDGSPRGTDPQLAMELDEYRGNVERLQTLLPVLQAHLLAERAHLEAERRQLEAAQTWAHTARKTT